MNNIYIEIEKLIAFLLRKRMIEKEDIIYTRNTLLAIFNLDEIKECNVKIDENEEIYSILDAM